jgi:competence protein ComEC
MLIDGGPDNVVLDQLGRAMPFFDRSLDVVVMTHPDSDHATGLVEVVRRYRIGKFVMTGVVKQSATYETLKRELKTRNVPVQYIHAGDQLNFSDGSTFSVLAPTESWQGREAQKANNTSIVGKFSYRNFSVLTTGDIEEEIEHQMLSRNVPLAATILKSPHHGSHTSSSEPFLQAVHPKAFVISLGADNSYGHPHTDVLARYASFRFPVYRTDQGGAVTIRSDGERWTVKHGLLFRMW